MRTRPCCIRPRAQETLPTWRPLQVQARLASWTDAPKDYSRDMYEGVARVARIFSECLTEPTADCSPVFVLRPKWAQTRAASEDLFPVHRCRLPIRHADETDGHAEPVSTNAECPDGSTLSHADFAEAFFATKCDGCQSQALTDDARLGASAASTSTTSS
jgi:hypothetical protein